MRLFLLVIFGFLVLNSPAQAAKVSLSGQVTYHERIALPDTATLEIQLIDQTLPKLPPRLAVKAPIGPGQVPLSFNLGFEDSLILPSHSYALVATIAVPAGVMFRNAEPYALNPLAPAQPVLITVDRFAPESSRPAASSEAPAAAVAPATILDTVWTATAINGTAVMRGNHPTLSVGADMRAGGSTGCNSWFAQLELRGDAFHLGQIGATLIACSAPVMAQEKAFTQALRQSARWQVNGDTLTLFGMGGEALLTFTR